VDLAAALRALLNSHDLRHRLGASARRRAEEFSIPRMASGYAALYARHLKTSGEVSKSRDARVIERRSEWEGRCLAPRGRVVEWENVR
jgi:hypothetical protein